MYSSMSSSGASSIDSETSTKIRVNNVNDSLVRHAHNVRSSKAINKRSVWVLYHFNLCYIYIYILWTGLMKSQVRLVFLLTSSLIIDA